MERTAAKQPVKVAQRTGLKKRRIFFGRSNGGSCSSALPRRNDEPVTESSDDER